MEARRTPATESRGRDGRTTNEPRVASGFDHGEPEIPQDRSVVCIAADGQPDNYTGVFVPFKLMFPNTDGPFEIPVVEVSMSSDLRPETEYQVGKALKALRWAGLP
jgi:hypothetical protein